MALLSIIMPVYGVEKYISTAISSVLKQSFVDWELIIVNDGSPDNSESIAQEFSNKDSRIKVVSKPNGGLSDARNFGLKLATGKYIHFFDSDDWIEPDFYKNMLNEIHQSNFDFIVGGYTVDYFTDEIRTNSKVFRSLAKTYGQLFSYEESLKVGEYINYAWNKIFLREFLIKNNLEYEYGLYKIEDAEFISRVLKNKAKWKFIKNQEYHYISRNRQTLASVFDDNTISFLIRSLSVYENILDSLNIDDEIKNYLIKSRPIGIYRSILGNLYSSKRTYSKMERKSIIKQLLSYKELKEKLSNDLTLSKSNKFLKFLILKDRIWLIDLIYSIKY